VLASVGGERLQYDQKKKETAYAGLEKPTNVFSSFRVTARKGGKNPAWGCSQQIGVCRASARGKNRALECSRSGVG